MSFDLKKTDNPTTLKPYVSGFDEAKFWINEFHGPFQELTRECPKHHFTVVLLQFRTEGVLKSIAVHLLIHYVVILKYPGYHGE